MTLESLRRIFRRPRPGGISPRRVRGVAAEREVPVVPEPFIKPPPAVDEEEYEYRQWEAVWGGTLIEFLAFRWLTKVAKLESGVDFEFQSSQLGGRSMPGGAVVDFDFPDRKLAWRLQGAFWHVGDPAVEGYDIMQKLALESTLGYTVVDIYEEDALQSTDYVFRQALQGIQIRGLRR